MTEKEHENIEKWIAILIGAIAIIAIKSIFENDNSKIISNRGRKTLSDSKKMNDINTKIQETETKNEPNEIFI